MGHEIPRRFNVIDDRPVWTHQAKGATALFGARAERGSPHRVARPQAATAVPSRQSWKTRHGVGRNHGAARDRCHVPCFHNAAESAVGAGVGRHVAPGSKGTDLTHICGLVYGHPARARRRCLQRSGGL
jgi:hypothetical protein